jgi:hypothetical protein
MLIEPDYKGYRIHVQAEYSDGLWDATVRIRRVLSDDKPHVEKVTCRKLTAEVAETRAAIWARRWVDLNGLAVTPTLADQLAMFVQDAVPYTYCYPCLASRFSVEEKTLRDTAQLLVFHDRELFTVARRVCIGCRTIADMLVYNKPDA